VWDAIGFLHAAAYTRYRFAEAALATGEDDDDAEVALRAAWDTARHLRARPLAEATERLARRARIALGGADAAAPPPGAGDQAADVGLTPREREVLALVAEGRTNRQVGEVLFISEKTASVHVSRLLAKLGASTRGEAAAVARRMGLLDEAPGI
jgi:DNA-binding NarL/FixJ family response regulator